MIWSGDCLEKEERKIDEIEGIDEKEKKSRKAKIPVYKYVGETSRSAFERSWEYLNCYKSLSDDSYMLKHSLDVHGEEVMSETRYLIKVLKYTRSPFERQVRESV